MDNGERPDRVEGDERRTEGTLEDFRERTLKRHDEDDEGVPEASGEKKEAPRIEASSDDGTFDTKEPPNVREGREASGAQGDAKSGGTALEGAEVENPQQGEGMSDEDLKEFRKKILEEYGPEGLGETIPEGQLSNPVREELSGTGEIKDGDLKETTSGDAVSDYEGSDAKATGGSDEEAPKDAGKGAIIETATHESGESTATTVSGDGTKDAKAAAREQSEKALDDSSQVEAATTGVENVNWYENRVDIMGLEQGTDRSDRALPDQGLESSGLHRFPSDSSTKLDPEIGAVNLRGISTRGSVGEAPEQSDQGIVSPINFAKAVENSDTSGEVAVIQERHMNPNGKSDFESPTYTKEVGREIGYDTRYASLTGKDSSEDRNDVKVEPGKFTEQREPAEVIRASGYGHTSAVLVPERMIPSHEQRYDVFEVRVAKKSEPEREYPLYATHKPGYDRAYLNLFQLNPKEGEEFFVKPGTFYSGLDFIREYNQTKPPGLENAQLIERDGQVSMKIGDDVLRFIRADVRTYQGQVVFDGTLEGVGEVKIAKSLNGFDFRLGDHSRVISIRDEGGAYKLEYWRTSHDRFPHLKMVQRPRLSELGEVSVEHKVTIDREGVTIERHLDFSTRSIWVKFSTHNQDAAWEYWRQASSLRERRVHIGDIGQSVAEIVLRKSDFGIIAKEPLGDILFSGKHTSERSGPDLVCEFDNRVIIVQVKHWLEAGKGLSNARDEVSALAHDEARLKKLEKRLGRNIDGGLAMEVHWSYRDGKGVIYAEYIKVR